MAIVQALGDTSEIRARFPDCKVSMGFTPARSLAVPPFKHRKMGDRKRDAARMPHASCREN